MSSNKYTVLAALLAFAEARFGQEQVPVAAVQALGSAGFGAPGVAATIAGSIPSSLLAAASPCDKLSIADKMITELGDDPQVIQAALGLVSAETNFNPFAVDKPFVCADPALPANPALRGVTPLVDPAVTDAATANALSAQSLKAPFNADGLSQAGVMLAQGFSTFTAKDAANQVVQLNGQGGGADAGNGAGNGGNAGNGNNNGNNNNDNAGNAGNAGNGTAETPAACPGAAPAAGNGADAGAGGDAGNGNNGNGNNGNGNNGNGNNGNNGNGNNGNGNNGNGNNGNGNNGNGNGNNGNGNNGNGNGNNGNGNNGNGNGNNGNGADNGAGSGGAQDFGICQPTMAFIGGLNGRPATEFTFIPQDPLVAQGQQEALNPNIITNRICDQLTNVCNASDAAKAACLDAKAQIQALGTRDKATADTWNALLGFAGTDSSVQSV